MKHITGIASLLFLTCILLSFSYASTDSMTTNAGSPAGELSEQSVDGAAHAGQSPAVISESDDEEILLEEEEVETVLPEPESDPEDEKTTEATADIEIEPFLFEEGEESIFEEEGLKVEDAPVPTVDSASDIEPAKKVEASDVPEKEASVNPESDNIDDSIPAALEKVEIVKAAPLAPTVVEDARSINFAKNLKEYRSPKLAMLFSLIIPGTGQAYAKNHLKTAIFGVIEVGVVTASIILGVKAGDKIDKAHGYADKRFSVDRFEDYYDTLKQYLSDEIYEKEGIIDKEGLDDRMLSIWWDSKGQFISSLKKDKQNKTDDYYDLIGYNNMVHGWDDAMPTLDEILETPNGYAVSGYENDTFTVFGDSGTTDADSAYLVFHKEDLKYGYSPHQETFNAMVSDGNQYYKYSTNVLFLLLVNHIGSAIDAGITAMQYNNQLLGKQSFWDRIDLEPQWVNTGSGMSPGYSMRLKF